MFPKIFSPVCNFFSNHVSHRFTPSLFPASPALTSMIFSFVHLGHERFWFWHILSVYQSMARQRPQHRPKDDCRSNQPNNITKSSLQQWISCKYQSSPWAPCCGPCLVLSCGPIPTLIVYEFEISGKNAWTVLCHGWQRFSGWGPVCSRKLTCRNFRTPVIHENEAKDFAGNKKQLKLHDDQDHTFDQ